PMYRGYSPRPSGPGSIPPSGVPAPGQQEAGGPVESGPAELSPVRPDRDRLVGRRHVGAGADRGQPPERGSEAQTQDLLSVLSEVGKKSCVWPGRSSASWERCSSCCWRSERNA
uniref:Uncharacterized protein n=1 Tax=Stegastes partitus TaxID=144197 RepID=A0A3B4ZTL5_9TELE